MFFKAFKASLITLYNMIQIQYNRPSPITYFLSFLAPSTWFLDFSTIRDISYLIVLFLILIILYLIVKKIQEGPAAAQNHFHDHRAQNQGPTVYNNKLSIHIWLSEIEEYLDANCIKNDRAKCNAVLMKLDTRTRATIQKLMDAAKVRTYSELEEALKSYFGREAYTSAAFVIKLHERRQLPNESINEFFTAIQELAQAAHPKLDKKHRDEFALQQFITGLRNKAVKNQLRLKLSTNDNIDVLAEAIDLNKTLPIEDDNDVFTCHHMHTAHPQMEPQPPQRQPYPPQQPYQPQQPPNYEYNQQPNRTHPPNWGQQACYKYGQMGHKARDCRFQQPMNENGANYGTQQQNRAQGNARGGAQGHAQGNAQGGAQGNQAAGNINAMNAANRQ